MHFYIRTIVRALGLLFVLGFLLLTLSLFAIDQPITPLDSMPHRGNHCVVQNGTSLHEDPYAGTFTLDVPGTPIHAYWYWSGRSRPEPFSGDDTIEIQHNNAQNNNASITTLTADRSLSSRELSGEWEYFTYFYNDSALEHVQSGANDYAVSGLNINGIYHENHGAGLVVIYESPECELSETTVYYGLDSFRWNRTDRDGPNFGPDSEVICTTFDAIAADRTLSFNLIVGGVANPARGNSLWYATGSGDPPYSAENPLTPDDRNAPRNGISELADPLNNNSGTEWDMYNDGIHIPAGHTYACMQIESPEDDDGVSIVWTGLVTSIPLGPEMGNTAIDIQKTPDQQTIESGSDATFTIRVENTGDVPLTDVTVSDPLTPDCDASLGTMQPADVQTYDCIAPNVEDGFTNIATVSATPPSGPPIENMDDATVTVQEPAAPAINIQKTPDSQTVQSGDTVAFTIQVENTGNVALSNVTVTDPLVPSCGAALGTMQPADVQTYTCVDQNALADYTNVAAVLGTPPTGPTVEDTDKAAVIVDQPAPTNPSIDIQKTPDEQQILLGFDAPFTIRVENTGDAPLTGVTVSDPLAPDCDASLGTMQPGDVQSYECARPNVGAGFTNIASVIGTPPSGLAVEDSDEAVVFINQPMITNPAIDIQKSADSPILSTGDTATFTIRVQNVGDVALTNVTVSDPLAPSCGASLGTMQPNQVRFYDCTVENVTRSFTNVASVIGTPPTGTPVEDSDSAEIIVADTAIDIQKTPDRQTVESGSDVTFTIRVENIGTAPLRNVAVRDPLVPACNATFDSLEPGDMRIIECTATAVTAGFTNVATVTGRTDFDRTGFDTTVSDQDDAAVIVEAVTGTNPSIRIDKIAETPMIGIGGTVTFTIIVENDGDVVLNNVSVSDPLAPSCSALIGTLQPDEQRQYQCIVSNVRSDFTNVAGVTGTPPGGNPVGDEDSASVVIGLAIIEINKSPENQIMHTGETATFAIRVDNIGELPLSDVTVTDTIAPDCSRTLGDLAPGAFTSYTCVLENVTTDILNIATVVGTPPSGPPVQDADDAAVTVDDGSAVLSVTKTDNDLVTQPGGLIGYTISFTNSGDIDAVNVVLLEIVPQHTTFAAAESDPNWVCENGSITAGTQCTYDVGLMPADSRSDLFFAVRVDTPLPPEVTTIVNEVLINGNNERTAGQSNTAIEQTQLAFTGLPTTSEPPANLDNAIYMPLITQ